MFKPTIEIFDQYCAKVGIERPDCFNSDLAAEVKERLQQLQWLLERIAAVEEQHDESLRLFRIDRSKQVQSLKAGKKSNVAVVTGPAPSFDAWITLTAEACLEIRLMTEAFYYFAARVRTILRHRSTPMPYLSSFECAGVRNVRNHLIEHPEGANSQVFVQSFTFGNPEGPVLKSGRSPDKENVFPDKGLQPNAVEFNENLAVVIRGALARA